MTGVSCSWVGNDSEDAGLVCKTEVLGGGHVGDRST